MRLFDRGAALIAAGGAAVGALAAYLLDPDRGRSRRARYAGQGLGILRRGARGTARTARVVGSDAKGKLEAMQAGTGGQTDLNDAALAEKVETELFRDPSIAKGRINVNVQRSVVVMRGEVDNGAQRRDLERQASRIAGVGGVDNLLRLRGEAASEERSPT